MAAPYELWETHTSLGVMRATKAEDWYFGQFFNRTILSEDEWIDFEKLPILGRKLAPFVKPLGRGRSVYTDSARATRFKPAYTIIDEVIDPLEGLSMIAGIDQSMLSPNKLNVMQRRALLKMQKTEQAMKATRRRWEWLRSQAIINAAVTITYEDGSAVVVDFARDADHTETLTGGDRWGEVGVSILDHIQTIVETMNNAEFGGMPTRMTMSSAVAAIVRADDEILAHMDINMVGGSVSVERGVVAGGPNGGKVYKFGEVMIGGASGAKIELWVNDETYDNNAGTATRYLAANTVIFTSTADQIMGYDCFGMIIDLDAQYRALPIFPKNYVTGDDVKVEHLSFKSSPIMVPINPDATYKVVAIT